MAVEDRPALGRPWRRTVRYVVARDGARCQLAYVGTWKGTDGTPRGCTGVATTADHIVPRSKGGSDRPDNLQASCLNCNRHKAALVTTPAERKQRDDDRHSRRWT